MCFSLSHVFWSFWYFMSCADPLQKQQYINDERKGIMPIGLFVADRIFKNHNNFLKGIMFVGACKAMCVYVERVFLRFKRITSSCLGYLFIYFFILLLVFVAEEMNYAYIAVFSTQIFILFFLWRLGHFLFPSHSL